MDGLLQLPFQAGLPIAMKGELNFRLSVWVTVDPVLDRWVFPFHVFYGLSLLFRSVPSTSVGFPLISMVLLSLLHVEQVKQ